MTTWEKKKWWVFHDYCIYLYKFRWTSKNARKCQKELGTFLYSKKCHEVSKNAKFAFFGTKNAKLATMTRVSHNKEAVLQDADLGTVGKHGLCRSISNSNSEAVGNDAGLGTVKNTVTAVPPPTPPRPLTLAGRTPSSSMACSTPIRTNWPTSSPSSAGTSSRTAS